MLAKTSYTTLARESEIGESSLRRHAHAHMAASQLRSIRENEAASTSDLIARLHEALTDASAVRTSALMAGNASLTLRAAAVCAQLTGQLATLVGTDAAAVQEDLQQLDLLRRLVATAVGTDHHAAAVIDGLLRRWNEVDTADDLMSIAAPDPATLTR